MPTDAHVKYRIQIRRMLEAALPVSAPEGEPLVTTDSHKLFVGTGAGIVGVTGGGSGGASTAYVDAGDATVASSVTAEASARVTAIANEATLRIASDLAEATARAAADTTLTTNVATNTTAIANEVTARGTAVTAEATTRSAADSTLTTNVATNTTAISNEVTRATAAEALAELLSHKDAASGYAGLTAGGLLKTAELPAPTSSLFGGVKALAAVSNKFLTSIGTDGVPVAAQPSPLDLSSLQTTTGTGYLDTSQCLPGVLTANQVVFGAINTIYLVQMYIPRMITINKLAAAVGTASNGSIVDFGLYSLAGNLVLNTGGITLGAGTGVISATPAQGAGTVLGPGWYMMAHTANSTVPKFTASMVTLNYGVLNVSFLRQGKSSTASSGGILPAGPIAGCPNPSADLSSFALNFIMLT